MIAQPRGFSEILNKLSAGGYEGGQRQVAQFLEDIRLPFRNAKTFYHNSRFGDQFQLLDQVTKDHKKLGRLVARFRRDHSIPEPAMEDELARQRRQQAAIAAAKELVKSSGRPKGGANSTSKLILGASAASGSASTSSTAQQRAADMHTLLKAARKQDAQKIFEEPVTRAAFAVPAEADHYFATVRQPLSLQEVSERLGGGQYDDVMRGPAAFLHDVLLPYYNANAYYSQSPFGDPLKMAPAVRAYLRNLKSAVNKFCTKYGLPVPAKPDTSTAGTAAFLRTGVLEQSSATSFSDLPPGPLPDRAAMEEILSTVQAIDNNGIFFKPVEKSSFVEFPGMGDEYFQIIERPMSFSELGVNLNNGDYDDGS